MEDLLIIGSGLSAWAVYQALRETKPNGVNIFILDRNYSFDNSSKIKSKYAGEKLYFGSNQTYARPNENVSFDHLTNLSQGSGGFSTIWGAGIRLWDQSKIHEIPVKSMPPRGMNPHGSTWNQRFHAFPSQKFLKFCIYYLWAWVRLRVE